MVPVTPARTWTVADQDAARSRHEARRERLHRCGCTSVGADTRSASRSSGRRSERARSSDAVRSAPMNPAKRRAIYETLRALNPNPTTELLYTTPFELLVAVVLSAQATDKG